MNTSPTQQLMSFETEHLPRAYVNSSVRFHHLFSLEQRMAAAEKAGWNVFQFPSEMLQGGDLLSDSGTTTPTAEQVAAMLLGDEAYGSNYGYFQLLQSFEQVFGMPLDEVEVFLFHQGRAAEHALFTQLGRRGTGYIVPSNGHFDTTHANIESNGMTAMNLFHPTLKEAEYHEFKGNMDTDGLKNLMETSADKVPVVFLTITNNTGGGQPVSIQNMEEVKALANAHGKSLFFDACRFAENAWFIQNREEQYKNASIVDIVKKVFSLCDGFTISLKKDGLSNMGGALVIRKNSLFAKTFHNIMDEIRDHQILVEGHPTYGGMSGRDIMVAAEGLKTVVSDAYLQSRIGQVRRFGEYLQKNGVPVLSPFGGHAVYIDIDKFFEGTHMQKGDFGGVSLTALLLLKGIRLCELGAFAFGQYNPETQTEQLPENNFVRCAVPRNKYEIEDLLYVADCVIELYKKRDQLPKAVPVYGRDLTLRHFKARFELRY